MLPPIFVIIGTIISSIGSIVYLISVIKGGVKPNKVSFLLWSIAPFIAFAAQIKQGVGLESLMTFKSGFLPLLIFVTSFINEKSKWKLTKFDFLCGILSIIGLILWFITKVGNIAIAFMILADGFACIPTMVKSYRYPDTEIAWPWLTAAIGILLTLLTLTKFTFANSSFLVYLFIGNFLIFSLVQFRIGEKLIKHKKSN